MASVIPATQVSIADLEDRFNLSEASEADFFPEWSTDREALTELEMQYLDRVKSHFKRLLKNPPLLENSVKMVVLSPLLDLAGFYDEPFHIRSEVGIEIAAEAADEMIRGRIDVLVLKDRLWILVLEAKRSDFDVSVATGHALTYMLSNPDSRQPTFAMISNGQSFLFLKLTPMPTCRYANSRLFSLLNPGNDLYGVLQGMRSIGKAAVKLPES
ncbi:MAG: restriction endonuclease subunit R [Cyanobacteria bacterium P01_F01_bin.86]